jgi:hypothetical protein
MALFRVNVAEETEEDSCKKDSESECSTVSHESYVGIYTRKKQHAPP